MADHPTETVGADADMSGANRPKDPSEMPEDMSGAGNVAAAESDPKDAPTVAPEEEGATLATERAPGADL